MGENRVEGSAYAKVSTNIIGCPMGILLGTKIFEQGQRSEREKDVTSDVKLR